MLLPLRANTFTFSQYQHAGGVLLREEKKNTQIRPAKSQSNSKQDWGSHRSWMMVEGWISHPFHWELVSLLPFPSVGLLIKWHSRFLIDPDHCNCLFCLSIWGRAQCWAAQGLHSLNERALRTKAYYIIQKDLTFTINACLLLNVNWMNNTLLGCHFCYVRSKRVS